MNQSIETKVADTILEQPIGQLTVDGTTYNIEPPTTATLIMVSELISQLPDIDPETPHDKVIPAVLAAAADADVLGKIAATFLLGARRIKEHPITTIEIKSVERRWSWRHMRRIDRPKTTSIAVFERDHLAERILTRMTPKDLNEFISAAISEAYIADFFVLTTSLHTKSLIKPTREVETTASGHSSEAGLNTGS